ncbi:MAG: hypothetical protein KTR24_12085 [Saprospiraceae bacterium]|nr:hypothetical protein [Saprospiraceae bacterium]
MVTLRTISAICLSLLVLVGSAVIRFDAHFCQGAFQHISIIKKASSCHEQAQSCHSVQSCCGDEQEQSDCCHNETSWDQLDADWPPVVDVTSLQDVSVAVADFQFGPFTKEDIKSEMSRRYRPPPLIVDVLVMHQVFIC